MGPAVPPLPPDGRSRARGPGNVLCASQDQADRPRAHGKRGADSMMYYLKGMESGIRRSFVHTDRVGINCAGGK
jgi:hypothetical protein